MASALEIRTEAQDLLAICTRVIGMPGALTSGGLAEALRVRGQLLLVLVRSGVFPPLDAARMTRQALADYNLVLAIDPVAVEAYNIRGDIRGMLSDFKGAMEDETTAINMRPTLYAAYFSRAEVLLKQNRANITAAVAESAIADYQKALQSPDIRDRSGTYIEGVIASLRPYVTQPRAQ